MTLLLKLWDPNRFERLAWFHIGNIFLVGNSVIQMKVFVSSKASFPVEMLQATASSFQVYSATIFPLLKCCSAGRGWLLLVWSTWTITLMFFTIVSKEPSSKPSKFLPYLWPCSTSESPCFWYCPFPAGHTKYHRLNQYIYIFFQIRHFQNTDNDECKCCHKISAHLLPGLYRIQFTMELTQEHRDSVVTPERKTPTVGEEETIRKTFSLSENKKKKRFHMTQSQDMLSGTSLSADTVNLIWKETWLPLWNEKHTFHISD